MNRIWFPLDRSKLYKMDKKLKIMGLQMKIVPAYHRKQSKDIRYSKNIGYFPWK